MSVYDSKIELGLCRQCGRTTFMGEASGMAYVADPSPLGRPEAITALLAGRNLYVVVGKKLHVANAARLANPDGPILADHGCPPGASKLVAVSATPKAPRAASERGQGEPDSPTRQPETSSAVTDAPAAPATPRPTEATGPRCSGCSQPCEDGTYAAIHLGELLQWAEHVDACPTPAPGS